MSATNVCERILSIAIYCIERILHVNTTYKSQLLQHIGTRLPELLILNHLFLKCISLSSTVIIIT